MSNKVYLNTRQDLNSQIVQDLVSQHYTENVGHYTELYDMYKGEHEILDRELADPNKPNNKLVNDYFGQIVDNIVGYFLGNPINITADNDTVQDELDRILTINDKDDLFMEVGKEMGIKGKSAVMVYQNEKSETKLTKLPPEEVIFVYDSSKTNELINAIRVYELEVVNGDDEVDTIKYCEVYDKDKITYYIQDADTGEFYLDRDKPKNPAPHIFGDVPIVPFVNNKEEQGDFEKVITLVNDFDKVLSDASNEHGAFRNAYLMLRNMMMDEKSIAELKQQGVFSVAEDGDVKFITKDIQTNALENHLDRLEENIYKFSQVPNLSDEKFANNLSGVAIKFKLFGLENKCIIKERKMTKSIKQLLKLLSVPIQIRTGQKLQVHKVDIKFSKNIPHNLKELSEVVKNLTGIVDKETVLSLLPFIENPDQIVDKLEEEQDIYAKDLKRTGNFMDSQAE